MSSGTNKKRRKKCISVSVPYVRDVLWDLSDLARKVKEEFQSLT
jgi:hypothetical protein